MWKLNSILVNIQWVKEIKRKKICFETQMEKTTYQNLWDGAKNCPEKKIYKQ